MSMWKINNYFIPPPLLIGLINSEQRHTSLSPRRSVAATMNDLAETADATSIVSTQAFCKMDLSSSHHHSLFNQLDPLDRWTPAITQWLSIGQEARVRGQPVKNKAA